MEKLKKYKYKKCKRLMEKIQDSYLEFGKNRIFLTGNELKDLFLRDIRSGYFDLKESIKDYVLHNNRFKWFIVLSSSKTNMKFFIKNKDRNGNFIFVDSSHNEFIPQEIKDESDLLNMNVREEEQEEENTQEQANLTEAEYIKEIIPNLLNKDYKSGEEVCLFIEDLDWIANFYDEKDNAFIKDIKELEKLKKHLVIISLKDKTILEETYYEKLDDKELIIVPRALTEEIEMTLYRLTWKSLKKNLKDLSLNDLALAFSNSKTSLKEVIRIFTKKLKEYGEDLKLENFEFKEKVKEKVYWEDIEIEEVIKEKLIKKRRTFKDGKSKEKGILLYGPPGTGKTMIAKAMATEEKLYFLAPKLSELKGEYVGQSAPKIKALFEEARVNEPTLIFLDEVDTLFPARDNGDGDSYTKDMVNEFLQQLDGVDTGEQKIIVLAATNREYMIDPAVKSRLGEPIKIDLPTQRETENMYNKNFKGFFEIEFLDLLDSENNQELIRKSYRMSGRDLKNLCDDIKKHPKFLTFQIESDSKERNKYFKDIMNEVFRYKIQNMVNSMKSKGLDVDINLDKGDILFGEDITKIKRRLKSYIKEITENEFERGKRATKGIAKRNGVLLYGPPGNGKSELVKDICKENGLIYVGVEGRSFTGTTEKERIDMIETIFEETFKLANICSDEEGVVLFFDEFDSLVGSTMSPLIRGTILTKLSQKKDGLRDNSSKILLMAATNFYEDIDEAVKRPGRFDEHFVLRNPREKDALLILRECFYKEKMREEDSDIFSKFYEMIRNEDVKTSILYNLTNLKDRYDITDSEVQEIIEEMEDNRKKGLEKLANIRKKYLCSASSIKKHVENFKRFLYDEELFEGNDIIITDELISKYKEIFNGD